MATSEGGVSSGSGGDSRPVFEHSGWVYHLGINSIKREYCHRRFLHIKGKYVMMYKRNPHEHPGTKPIRSGVVGHTLVLEELGRRKVNDSDLYVLKFSNRLDEEKKGEIACATAKETRKWMEALEQAKKQAEYELFQSSNARDKLSMENEIDLERHSHRRRVKRYANGLKRLINTKHGESLVRRSLSIGASRRSLDFYEGDAMDVVEEHDWKCVCTLYGVRIYEDVSGYKGSKGVLVKAVGVMEVSVHSALEVILSLDKHQRYEWDALTSSLELVDSISGHSDVVYGTYDPRYLTRWRSRRDFILSRQWFCDQDGTYTILQFPVVHKKRPPKSGYRRTKINASTWEIKNLSTHIPNATKCLVTHMLEVQSKSWTKWKTNQSLKFEKTVAYALLNQVSGLKAYFGGKIASEANSTPKFGSSAKVSHKEVCSSMNEFEDDDEVADNFYDAISAYSSSTSEDDDSDYDDTHHSNMGQSIKSIVSCVDQRRSPDLDANKELNSCESGFIRDHSHFPGTMSQGRSDTDTNCWMSPSGSGFMIRGKTYLKDSTKVSGGEPFLKLIAVDWFKVNNPISKVALHPKCLVQSEAGKKLPFVLVMNLQVPAKPNYSLVLYFAADRPVMKDSLLGRFIDETDTFRDSRFKLIPSIVENIYNTAYTFCIPVKSLIDHGTVSINKDEYTPTMSKINNFDYDRKGYWMVKRAVGTKACLLAKAVSCNYVRQDNFLEIDVDVGSSSVARSVIGIVLGYVTSIVVDLAILIEGKEQEELPEYILGTVRLNRVRLESAVPLES